MARPSRTRAKQRLQTRRPLLTCTQLLHTGRRHSAQLTEARGWRQTKHWDPAELAAGGDLAVAAIAAAAACCGGDVDEVVGLFALKAMSSSSRMAPARSPCTAPAISQHPRNAARTLAGARSTSASSSTISFETRASSPSSSAASCPCSVCHPHQQEK